MITPLAMSRYRRQITLSGFGLAGQERLNDAHVAVIGAGGLGSPALLYLAAAGVGTITIIDDDAVELSNLHRQIVHTDAAIGEAKAESARREMLARNPALVVRAISDRLTAATAIDLLHGADVVLDGTDNFSARYAASHACAALGIPHIWGSILGFDAQMSVFWAGHGPIYEDVFPTPPPAGTVPSCSAAGVLGPVVGIIGTAMALEAVKLVTNTGEPLLGRLGYFDGLAGTWEYIPLAADPAIADRVRSRVTVVADDFATEPSDDRYEVAVSPDLSPDLSLDLRDLSAAIVLDVREPEEFSTVHIPGAVNVPLSALRTGVPDQVQDLVKLALRTARPLVVYCASGVRSEQAVEVLAASGIDSLSYPGGINAWLELQ